MTGGGVGGLGGVGDAGVELGLARGEHGLVDGDAGLLHLGQGGGHGHLQLGEEHIRLPLLELALQDRGEVALEGGAAGGHQRLGRGGVRALGRGERLQVEGGLLLTIRVVGPQGSQVDAQPALRQGVDIVAALLGAAQVAGQRRVEDDAVECQAAGAQGVPGALGVGDDQGGPGTAEQVE